MQTARALMSETFIGETTFLATTHPVVIKTQADGEEPHPVAAGGLQAAGLVAW